MKKEIITAYKKLPLVTALLAIAILSFPQNTYSEEMKEMPTQSTTSQSAEVLTAEKLDELWDQLKQIPPSTREPHPEITDLLEQYFPLGMDQQEAIKLLTDFGFSMRDLSSSRKNSDRRANADTFLSFGKDFWLFPNYFWKHRVGISLDFGEGKLVRRKGRIFYTHPLY